MTRQRPSTRDARRPRVGPDVPLQPPPRPGAPDVRSSERTAASSSTGRSAAALALLAVLAAAVVGVFVFLPRWMASRPRPVAVAPRPAEPAQATLPESPKETREAPASAHEDEPTIPARASARHPASHAGTPPPAEDPGAPEWTRAMSDGLAALDRGQFAEAQAAFARAEAARPGTRVVADAIKRTEEGLKGEALSRHRTAGEAAEAREDWRGALAEYDAALKLEPQVAFAQQGRARSLPRAVLDETLAGYLRRPERLSAEAVAREAEGVLDARGRPAPAGPRLQQQTAALERLLRDARTPVDVRLVSDGLTEVSVLRVGSLGTFREKKVALRPGSYVVLGKRQGYRDSRQTLVVTPTPYPAAAGGALPRGAMTLTCLVEEDGRTRRFEEADFPLALGGPEADVEVPGLAGEEPAAFLALDDGELFAQPRGPVPVSIGGRPVTASQWLRDGDEVRLLGTRIRVAWRADRQSLHVQHLPLEPPTEPPVLVVPAAYERPAEGDALVHPADYRPRPLPLDARPRAAGACRCAPSPWP